MLLLYLHTVLCITVSPKLLPIGLVAQYHKIIYLLYLLYGLFTDRTGGRHGQGPGEAQGVEQVAAGGAPGAAHRGQTHLVRGIIGSN